MKQVIPVLLLAVAITACKNGSTDPESEQPGDLIETPLSFDTLLVEKEWGDCQNSEEGCITITLEYPQIKEPDSLGTLLNRQMQRLILGDYADTFEVISDYATFLLFEYERQSGGSKTYPGWQIEKQLQVAYSANQLLALRLEVLENTGGARGQHALSFSTWFYPEARRLLLEDIFLPHSRDTLLKLAHYHLEQAMQVSMEMVSNDLSSFSAEGFQLSEQFLLDENGISFVYVQGAAGTGDSSIEFTIPYTELIEYDLINEKGPLSFLLGSVNL